LLAVGHGSGATGYSRVLASILSRVAGHFETVHFALNYSGPVLQREYKVLPNFLPGDPFGKKQLPALLEQYRPDIIFLYHDIEFYPVHRLVLNRYKEQNPLAVVVFYCPIEWGGTLPGNLAPLAEADQLVFFTEFGRSVFERAVHSTGVERNLLPGPAVIPHGVDWTRFFPLVPDDLGAGRRKARARLFPGRPSLSDAFLVLNANRNCPRKRIETTLRIFAEFARGKPGAYLYLHMGMLDRGCDVLSLARNLEIESRLLSTTRDAAKPEIPDEHLNLIYNACDVGINTSTGEGWGLVAMEHAATGAPQILPAHSACLELWAEHGILVPVSDSADGDLDSAYAVRQLNLLHSQPDLLLHHSRRSLAYARDPKFSWDRIGRQWADLLAAHVCPA
jgi:D-inositol-3-phosphate glycosyltransferase